MKRILCLTLIAACLGATAASATVTLGVTPLQLNMGIVPSGAGAIGKIVIVNTGDEDALLDVHIANALTPFGIRRGGGLTTLEPGGRHVVWVGYYAGGSTTSETLFISADAPTVRLTASMGYAAPCAVTAYPVDFDILHLGERLSFQLPIANNSASQILRIDPVSANPNFRCEPEHMVLPPLSHVNVTVTFEPVGVGSQVGSILLGGAGCTPITVRGECAEYDARTEDLVGVWWDEGLTQGISEEVTAGRPFRAWLAMLNPSEPEGVGGWELKLDLDPATYVLHARIPGLSHNFLDPPSFFVGLATPLPWAPEILLAELDLMVLDQVWHEVGLVPIDRESINGRMAWAYGEDYALKPLYPTRGGPVVAWFRASSTVATVAPTPLATVADGRVELRWPVPADGADGCHVYRTLDGREARLTADPLPPGGGGYFYADDTSGLPAGATTAYCYAVLRGGTEIARSPEVSVQLPVAGVFATQLLPNRPNPFNPETEVRFTLAAGGPVTIVVYDLAGRAVRTLAAAEPFAAGEHGVTWRGRDDLGRSVPAGTYMVRLSAGRETTVRKVLMIK